MWSLGGWVNLNPQHPSENQAWGCISVILALGSGVRQISEAPWVASLANQ